MPGNAASRNQPGHAGDTQVSEAFNAAGLRIIEHSTTDRRDSRYYEELDQNGGRDVMRLARVLRGRDQITPLIGADDYERLVGYYLWNAYLLLGKLTYGVWVAERRVDSDTSS